MKKSSIKKVLAIFLVLFLTINTGEISFAKKITPSSAMLESLGNSLLEGEYPSEADVLPSETQEDKDAKVIKGGVATAIDINLANSIRLALGNNPRIRAAMNDAMAAHTRIAQAWSNYFPQISWTTQASKIRQLELEDAFSEILVYNYYLLGQITLSQMLYDFGVTQNQVTIKKISYEQYKTTLTGIINDVIYRTKDAYYNLLFAHDQYKIAVEDVEKYEKFYNQAKAFYEVGLKSKNDVTIAQVNLSKAKLQLITAENAIDLAVAKLNKEMGVPYYNKYNMTERLSYFPIKMSLEDAVETAKKSRPELKVAELKVEEANQTVKLSKKAYNPVLEFNASYARGGASWNSNYGYNYGIYLNFPTINVLYNQKQIQEAKSLYQKELANAQETKNSIYLEIQEAYLTLEEKKKKIPVSIIQIKQAEANYKLSFGRYHVGAGTSLELKESQVSYNDALLNYYKGLYEYNSAKALLEKAIGKNIVEKDNGKIDIN